MDIKRVVGIAFIENGKLSAGHARTLLSLDNEKQMLELANLVILKKLSVRDLEQYIKKLTKATKQSTNNEKSLELKSFTDSMNNIFATKVSVLGNDNKGRIIINYYSAADLQRIYDIINK